MISILVIAQVMLDRVVTKTEGFEVRRLEKLYALLCQTIYRHRRDYNKSALLQVGSQLALKAYHSHHRCRVSATTFKLKGLAVFVSFKY